MALIKSKTYKPLIVGNVRQSQAITSFGIGSMVDFVSQTAMIYGTDKWDWSDKKEYRIYNVNLQNLLGVKYFVKPKISQKETHFSDNPPDLPAVIFPKVLYNPKCKSIEQVGKKGNCRLENGKYKCYCEKCGSKGQYLPSRFVLVCPKGHIEDFPYHWWVHEAQGKTCVAEKPKLRMYYAGNKTDMDSLYIECSCGAKRSMKGASARNAFANFRCSGNRPWLGDHEECDAHEKNEYMQMRIRNESSVYFPCTVSALTIPPWSRKISKRLQEVKSEFEKLVGKLSDDDKYRIIQKICTEFPNAKETTVEDLFNKLIANENVLQTMQAVMEDEYDVILSDNISDQNSDYISHTEEVPEAYDHIIEKVVSIERLTVVTAMVGFTRLIAPLGYDDPNLLPISKKKKEWYPGIEQKGEGVFIKFDQKALDDWATKYKDRYQVMGERLEESFFENDRFSPQYVFLHTFAHLFIRELSNLCGYNAASIRERIYSTYIDSKKKMSGVLVYTSTADSDGSLGGLTEQSKKINMERLIKSMLERAKWCSSDPVCYSSKEQGFMSLNYAACFACTLLPETSCEFRNILLDGCSVCGMPGNEDLGVFNRRK